MLYSGELSYISYSNVILHQASVSEMLAVFKFSQLRNAPYPMLVTPEPMWIYSKAEQPLNAQQPILVTLSGMVIEAIALHVSNAESPMIFTP